MVTPELKWPTTNFTPSPTNLLATETPCLGSDTSSPTDSVDLLAEDAAGGVDVLDGLLGAVLQLRAEGGVRAGDRAGDAELDLGIGDAGEGEDRAERDAAQQQFLHESNSPVIELNGPDVRPSRRVMPPWMRSLALFPALCHASSSLPFQASSRSIVTPSRGVQLKGPVRS